MQIYSFSPFGYEGSLVTVEVDLRRGIPAVDVVGLADGAVKEARERMQAAIRNSGFEFPPERVLISLSPADLKKEGAGFDLPIALSVLYANEVNTTNSDSFLNDSLLIMGELELSGNIRPVKGIHAAVSTAYACGIKRCIVPKLNAEEAREVNGMLVFGAENLNDAFAALKDSNYFTGSIKDREFSSIPEGAIKIEDVYFSEISEGFQFGEIKNQEKLIRALQIAAAGGHNLIAVGAPGCGKTMAIQKFPSLLPYLTLDEAQSTTRIWSLAGLLQPSEPLVRIPPFRMPHQTSTIEGICGGGPYCRPGEISLSHNGILFLDEAAEFRSSVLQMLRVPIEGGKITLSRAGRSTVYPAQFQLLMAANPCPCGNYNSKTKLCLCSTSAIDKYWKKFSAPLLDRVDLRISISNENERENTDSSQKSWTTEELRIPIAKAVSRMRKRQTIKNARLSPEQIAEFCPLSESVREILDKASVRYGFSPRATSSCIKTARTIADLADEDNILDDHMEEAISFRKVFNSMFDDC